MLGRNLMGGRCIPPILLNSSEHLISKSLISPRPIAHERERALVVRAFDPLSVVITVAVFLQASPSQCGQACTAIIESIHEFLHRSITPAARFMVCCVNPEKMVLCAVGNSISRRHHYIPQGLLNQFTDKNGRVWLYDGEENRRYATATINAGQVKDLYTLDRPDGLRDRNLENLFFSAHIDGPGHIAIKALLDKQVPDDEQMRDFFIFLAAQYHRTPAALERVSALIEPIENESLRRAAKHAPEFCEKVTAMLRAQGATEADIVECFASIERGAWKIKPDTNTILQLAIDHIETTACVLAKLRWGFAEVPDGGPSLVISDHPVSLRRLRNRTGPLGFAYPDVEVTTPLSSQIVALGRYEDGPNRFCRLVAGAADFINAQQMRNAKRFVYANHGSDDLLKSVVGFRGTGPQQRTMQTTVDGRLFITNTLSS